ncbi:MAG: pyruvate kinase [Actinomycetota bacterium]
MHQPRIQILCTLGPASLDPAIVGRLDECGVDLFRINLSHTPLEVVEATLQLVRSASPKPICLDTEGPQVRCGLIEEGTVLTEGRFVRLVRSEILGTADSLTLRPAATFDVLAAGSVVEIDFDGVELRVTEVGDDHAEAVVTSPGRVRSNKAVVVEPAPPLPTLSQRDLAGIQVGAQLGITHYAMSFARSADDVALIRRLAPPGSYIIGKIESSAGVRGMDGIITAADAVLIDRGDLSKEIPLEYVPFYQKAIVRRANRWTKPVFVATNLLESMTANRTPTVAEANDIANTLLDGVHGLVLAAETAIGIDPVGSVAMVGRLIRAFERTNFGSLLERDRQLAALPVE